MILSGELHPKHLEDEIMYLANNRLAATSSPHCACLAVGRAELALISLSEQQSTLCIYVYKHSAGVGSGTDWRQRQR